MSIGIKTFSNSGNQQQNIKNQYKSKKMMVNINEKIMNTGGRANQLNNSVLVQSEDDVLAYNALQLKMKKQKNEDNNNNIKWIIINKK